MIDSLESVQEIPFWFLLLLVVDTWKSYLCFILLYVCIFFLEFFLVVYCNGNNKNKNLMSTKMLFIFQHCSESVTFVFVPANVLIIFLYMWNTFLVSWISQVGYCKWHDGMEVSKVSYL